MKYVSKCVLNGVLHKSLRYDSHRHQAQLLVLDSEVDEAECPKKVPKTGVLGVWGSERVHLVTCLERYQVDFFKYVRKVRTHIDVRDTPLCDCNILTGDRFDVFEPIMYSDGKQTLVVTFEKRIQSPY